MYRVLVGEILLKSGSLEEMRRWEVNIKMYHREVGCEVGGRSSGLYLGSWCMWC